MLIVLTLALLLETFSLAWVSDNGLSSIINVSGSVHKNYFAYGKGTKDEPYGIDNPVQLYYFSWLQYLGFFNNTDNDGDGFLDSFYFELADYIEDGELDMTGYKLPPIGTTENPFIGNFDGNGITISNLTVRNFYTQLSAPPSGTDDFRGAEIIGFFGVIGSLDSNSNNYNYHTQENQVKNLALKDFTIITQTKNTLVGIVAGYVNGTVDCVGVIGGKVNIQSTVTGALTEYTNNFSDYSLIGHCTAEYKDSVYVMDVTISKPGISGIYNVVPDMTSDGEGHGWGGSVKMLDIYTWLSDLKDNAPTSNNYIIERTDVVDLSGKTVTVNRTNEGKKTHTQADFGSFVFSSSNNANYVNFVSGGQKVTKFEYAYTNESVTVYYVTDNENNYLSFDGTNIFNATNTENATKWYASNGTNGGVISTVHDNTVYYLTINDGDITTIKDTNANVEDLPEWERSGSSYSYNGSSIECVNGVWQLAELENIKIKVNGSSNFLDVANNSTTNVGNATNDGDAANWTIRAVDNGYTVSTVINNTTYYLGYETENSGGWFNQETPTELILSTTPTTWQFSNNQLYVEVSGWFGNVTNYYVRYNNGWTISNTPSTLEFVNNSDAVVNISSSGTTAQKIVCKQSAYIDNSTVNSYYDDNGVKQGNNNLAGITYFPLSSTVEGSVYKASTNNTGYIVGAEWDDETVDESRDAQDNDPSNIRISQYLYTNNSMRMKKDAALTPYAISYKTGNEFVNVSQMDADQLKGLGLVKYASCYGDYADSVETGCNGIHFMDAPILKENVVEITAHLNGDTKYNYQVPTNCIDFNLYERGFINAFAGSYYRQVGGTGSGATNNSFFSINQVFRDPTNEKKITDIKEIKTIYGVIKNNEIDTNTEYIYEYTDGSFSKTLASNYQVIFDCNWITRSDNVTGWADNRAFYFEIPVNAGEYAIGSTEGRTGAYLIYLDLAANAQIIERQKDYEKIVEEKEAGSLPKGVELLAPGETLEKVDPSNSAFVSINKVGEIVFSTTDGVTITHTAKDGTSAEYIGPGVTLKDGNGNIMQMQGVTTTIERTTYRDHNLNTGEYTVTVITKTTVGSNVTYGRTITKGTWNSDTNSPENMVLEEDIDNQPGELFPKTQDSEKNEGGGAVGVDSFIKLYYSYGQSVNLTVKYEYTYSETNPTYNITVAHDGADDVNVKAVLTSAGVSSNLTFYINGQVLNDTVDPQTVTVSGTPAEG